jgi:transcriptional regulator with XRE-family HTH domain
MPPVSVATTPLGNAIRLARWDRGWSQTQLGTEIGVAQSIISAWENGRACPSVAHLLRLADVLNVAVAAFLDAVAVEESARVTTTGT